MNSDNIVHIPEKLYFKIGEVCKITGVKQHVLRYWESEFPAIRPQRAQSRQRLYRRIDVENILRIKKLLHEEGFTIAGARKHLARKKAEIKVSITQSSPRKQDIQQRIKEELYNLKHLLEK